MIVITYLDRLLLLSGNIVITFHLTFLRGGCTWVRKSAFDRCIGQRFDSINVFLKYDACYEVTLVDRMPALLILAKGRSSYVVLPMMKPNNLAMWYNRRELILRKQGWPLVANRDIVLSIGTH